MFMILALSYDNKYKYLPYLSDQKYITFKLFIHRKNIIIIVWVITFLTNLIFGTHRIDTNYSKFYNI